MARFAFSLDDDTKDWLESEAGERDLSQGEIVRRALALVRHSDSLGVSDLNQSDTVRDSELYQSDTESDTAVNHIEQLQERVDEHEERIAELEQRSPASRGGGETPETTVHTGEEPDNPLEPSQEQVSSGSDVRERVREWIGDGPPRKSHAKDAVVEAVALLVEQGPMETAEVQDALWPQFEDKYSTARTFWNSISRHLEEVPGVTKPGYGEWDADPAPINKSL